MSRKNKREVRNPKLPTAVRAWTPEARQAWIDGADRYRSVRIDGKRRPAPSAREWAL